MSKLRANNQIYDIMVLYLQKGGDYEKNYPNISNFSNSNKCKFFREKTSNYS